MSNLTSQDRVQMGHAAIAALLSVMGPARTVLRAMTDEEFAEVTKNEREAAKGEGPNAPHAEGCRWFLDFFGALRTREDL